MLLSFVARKVGKTLLNKRSMSFAQRKALQKAQAASAKARKTLKFGRTASKSYDKTKAHNLKALKELKRMSKKKGAKPSWIKKDIAAVTKGMASNQHRHDQINNLVRILAHDVGKKNRVIKGMEKSLTKKYGAGMVKSASRGNPQVRAAGYVAAGIAAGGAAKVLRQQNAKKRAAISSAQTSAYQTSSNRSTASSEAAKLTAKYKKLTKGIA